jgi:hypothetical protein
VIRSPDTGFWQTGHPYRTLRLKFVSILRERIVAGGPVDARRLDRLIAEAELHLAKPASYVIHPLLIQAWGRKPTDQPNDLAREIQRDVARVARRQPQPEVTALDQFRRDPVPAQLKRFVPVPAQTPRDPKANQTATGGLGAAAPSSAGR